MEVLLKYGTEEQKAAWLPQLLDGRSANCLRVCVRCPELTQHVRTSAVLDGDNWVINGEKFYISGAGDPRCKIMIVMVRTSPDAPPSKQQSQILVPIDTPGVEILEGMKVFGKDHAPQGHMHIRFNNVRVPKENILLGEGRGFEISQVRLGPGRIHHCMRSIGKAEKALELMVKRSATREAFGKPIAKLGGNLEIISRARIEINAMRLAVLQAARAMDVLGNKEARVYVSAVKAMVPEKVCLIIDQAIQMHGAAVQDLAMDAAGRHVHGHAPPALCRWSGRSPSHGRRPRRGAEARSLVGPAQGCLASKPPRGDIPRRLFLERRTWKLKARRSGCRR